MSNATYHEDAKELPTEVRDMHRAIASLMDELEAVDIYNQRASVCQNADLKAILEHNRDEEKEHIAMLIEWIRRHDAAFSGQLKEMLFTKKIIATKPNHAAEHVLHQKVENGSNGGAMFGTVGV